MAVPRVAVPSSRVTVPVGVAPEAVAVAVKVIAVPKIAVDADDASVTVVARFVTFTVVAALVEGVYITSPLYTAVMLCDPIAKVEVE